MNKPEVIIIHHSAVKDNSYKDFDAIKRYHENELKMKDIGYHYIIEEVNGIAMVIKGRAENINGAHTKQNKMNYKSIGICVVGNYDRTELPSNLYECLIELIADIRSRHGDLPLKKHSDYANKTCPGLNFPFNQLVEATSGPDYEGRWATPYIEYCLEAGLMTGYADGSFKPTKTVTREELAIVVARLGGYNG